MRPHALSLALVTAAVGSAGFAAPAGAAYRCGSVDLPATDGRASTKVTKGSPGCSTARSLMVETWRRTLFENKRSVTVRRNGRAYGCAIGKIRTRMVCSHRSRGGRLLVRVRANVV